MGVDDGLGDPRVLQQHGLDLAELDPVAADLDLRVDAPEVLDLAVVGDPAEVAGAVDPAGRVVRRCQEVGDEGLAGQVLAVHVAAGQPDAGDADLADLAVAAAPAAVSGSRMTDRVGRQRHARWSPGGPGRSSVQVAVTVASVGP